MEKQIISTKHAPAAVGPYSQGVRAGHFLYTAGQIALDPATGKMVEGDSAAQTRQVMGNLQAILEAAGSSLDKVVKTTVFLQDMDDFAQMNGIYGQFFEGDPPARSTVQVAGLPLGALVEIEAIALIPHQ
ncbi:MAG: RidA family protein [Candidatus Promineifilaceae bacterium]